MAQMSQHAQMLQHLRQMSRTIEELADERDQLRSELIGALQLNSYLMQTYAKDGLIIPVETLAKVGGSVRIRIKDGMATIIAVTPEQIQQAIAEAEMNAKKEDDDAALEGGEFRAQEPAGTGVEDPARGNDAAGAGLESGSETDSGNS